MKKWMKYTSLGVVILLAGYNSIYIRRLSEVRAAAKAGTFEAATYARHFLDVTLPAHPDKAVDLAGLSRTLTTDPARAFSESHAQNDGNNRFFLVKGSGRITRVDSEYIYLNVEGMSQPVMLATRYIIGTAARDGSGLISVDEFTTTMEMNSVSEELNKLIRTQVVPPFVRVAKAGDRVLFTGAIELQKNKAAPDSLEVTPLNLNIQ